MDARTYAGIVLGLGLGAAACSDAATAEPSTATAETPAVAQAPASAGPIAFGLESRDHQLWFHAGAPRRYTVKDKQGTLLADAIDDARLQADYPELFELARGAIDADDTSSSLIDVIDY